MKKVLKVNEISPLEAKYTQILEHIALMPKMLRYLGILPSERLPSVAVVGSRKPTRYGEETAYKFAYELAQRGVVIVSGLALGTDAIAHTAALDAGGTTIAVLGNGLPRIYPSTNHALAERILDNGGAILSEFDENYPPLPPNFLQRNRIVSGLSDAVLVIEANERSGTLSTAAHALSQNRLVYAVPGNITSPLSAGCNNLLKQGAAPATSPDDILLGLGLIEPAKRGRKKATRQPEGATEKAIYKCLQDGATDGDEIITRLAISASDFAVAMTMLEIGGFVSSLGANKWAIA
jgi:DNA processing protein